MHFGEVMVRIEGEWVGGKKRGWTGQPVEKKQ